MPSQPLSNPDALRNPLVNESYRQELLAESERLAAEAEVKFNEGRSANQTGDDYVLATVMFASVLVFAGISSKFARPAIRAPLVVLALVMVLAGAVQVGSLLVH